LGNADSKGSLLNHYGLGSALLLYTFILKRHAKGCGIYISKLSFSNKEGEGLRVAGTSLIGLFFGITEAGCLPCVYSSVSPLFHFPQGKAGMVKCGGAVGKEKMSL
jgi:hypothetical protein